MGGGGIGGPDPLKITKVQGFLAILVILHRFQDKL